MDSLWVTETKILAADFVKSEIAGKRTEFFWGKRRRSMYEGLKRPNKIFSFENIRCVFYLFI